MATVKGLFYMPLVCVPHSHLTTFFLPWAINEETHLAVDALPESVNDIDPFLIIHFILL